MGVRNIKKKAETKAPTTQKTIGAITTDTISMPSLEKKKNKITNSPKIAHVFAAEIMGLPNRGFSLFIYLTPCQGAA